MPSEGIHSICTRWGALTLAIGGTVTNEERWLDMERRDAEADDLRYQRKVAEAYGDRRAMERIDERLREIGRSLRPL